MKNDVGVIIPAVPDERLCNTDHIPMYKEDVGKYSWSEKNSGGRQIRTGGAEKERFTVQPTITKSGRKLKLLLFSKVLLNQQMEDYQGMELLQKRYTYETLINMEMNIHQLMKYFLHVQNW